MSRASLPSGPCFSLQVCQHPLILCRHRPARQQVSLYCLRTYGRGALHDAHSSFVGTDMPLVLRMHICGLLHLAPAVWTDFLLHSQDPCCCRIETGRLLQSDEQGGRGTSSPLERQYERENREATTGLLSRKRRAPADATHERGDGLGGRCWPLDQRRVDDGDRTSKEAEWKRSRYDDSRGRERDMQRGSGVPIAQQHADHQHADQLPSSVQRAAQSPSAASRIEKLAESVRAVSVLHATVRPVA